MLLARTLTDRTSAGATEVTLDTELSAKVMKRFDPFCLLDKRLNQKSSLVHFE
jgi:hypothetical protein